MKSLSKEYKAGFPGAVYVGAGCLRKANEIVKEKRGNRVVVLVDRAVEILPQVQELFRLLGDRMVGVVNDVSPEPTNHAIQGIYEQVRKANADFMIAIGGGSVMDMTKVVSCAVTNQEYAAAGFMDSSYICNTPIPTIMVPTTAGTGAEATPNAIFLIPEQELKVGVVSDYFVANSVILDPELTIALPAKLTASTGIDALCHAIESYISMMATPISRTFSLRAVELIVKNIETAYKDGNNVEARENMLLGSFFAGLCLSSSSTVAVHAMSYPLGGKYHIPHGLANAILLPGVLKENLSHCETAYERLANAVFSEEELRKMDNAAQEFVEYVCELCGRLGIPKKLTQFGVNREDLDYLTDNAMEVKRLLSNNPKKLTREEIKGIYEELL